MADIPIPSAGPVDVAIIDDLVAANRILAQNGVLDAWGHVSIRHPANPDRYLLSRARAPALVSAEDIMEFDLDSNPVDQRGRRVFLERFIHGQAYRARPDVNAVVHSHSPTMIPFSVTGEPLKAISHIASFLVEEVPVWEIRDVGITQGLRHDAQEGVAWETMAEGLRPGNHGARAARATAGNRPRTPEGSDNAAPAQYGWAASGKRPGRPFSAHISRTCRGLILAGENSVLESRE